MQLKPLIDQLARVKDLPVPEFGSLQAWELRANAAGRSANGDLNANDHSKSSQGLVFGGTPMPYVGETKVALLLLSLCLQGLVLCHSCIAVKDGLKILISGQTKEHVPVAYHYVIRVNFLGLLILHEYVVLNIDIRT